MATKQNIKLSYTKLDKILHKKIPLIITVLEKVEVLVKTLRRDLMECIEDEKTSSSH